MTTGRKLEPRAEKVQVVEELKEMMKSAKITILTDYQGAEGLKVSEMSTLRRKLREGDGEFRVVKNTLASRAAREVGLNGIVDHLSSATALAFGYKDPVAFSKVLVEFAREHKSVKNEQGLPLLKLGVLEGKVLYAEDLKALATLPPQPVLMAQVLGTLKAPIQGFASVLSGNIRNFLYLLQALQRKRSGEAAQT